MKKIAVFGANGNLGRQAVKAFQNAGWQVRAITRDGKFEHGDGVETASADAMNEAQVIAASNGCDVIFNSINPPYPQWKKMCMPMARNMMAAAVKHGALHLFPGNVYNFGSGMPATLRVSTPQNADTVKGKIRVKMEELFEQTARENGVQTIIVRAGDFFGGTRTGASWFDLAISKKLHKAKIIYPGPLDEVHSWTYLPDFALSFVKLAEQADSLNKFEVFHFEGHAITGSELKSALETVLGKPLKHQGMPWSLLRMAAIFSPMLKEVCEMSYLWRVPHRIDGTRLAKQIGQVPHTHLETALSQALVDLAMNSLVEKTVHRQLVADAR